MKQTAVEWLIKEIETLITIETFEKWKGLKEQAKEMEKQQIIDAYKQGQFEFDGDLIRESHAEQYYNETFKH